ncbi:putative phosphate acyltransferase, contains PlsC domain [Handroanthus impetiginosus]|uniref:Putative phosphate acyltransferase, contains PlsC domain n=1 Tax=Handroanthus impetiginosus TaxID=429701 RepID=A0A2G9H4L8_9LAMI|nr:putative phosphate acyltransferase, contains PlsC domain [Handroanthus impetiginosus]
MESELKDLPPKTADVQPESDDRPLLKPEPQTPRQPEIQVANQSIEDLEKKYAPFVRHDVYGPMGRGELPWVEKFLLGLGLMFLVPIRVVVGVTMLVFYYVICRICTAFLAPNREEEQEDYAHMGGWRRAVIMQSGRFLSRVLLFVLGFYWVCETRKGIEAEGHGNNESASTNQSEEVERPGVIISNHVSHIDILYHMSSSFPSFVAKRSVAKLPLVGLISKCLGCVYVQRELKSSDFKGVSGVITERIREAHQNKFAPKMMLFPEGTTTNGDYLLPFKTGAFLAKAPVLPVILRYPYQRFSPAWDSISGARHVILLLCQFVNYIEVTHLSVYHPSEQEKENPKLYAENVRQLMAREGKLTLSEIGLAEKRVYHAALNGLLCQR